MNEKIENYINTIIEAKGGKENLYGIPTDIIGFDEFGKNLALVLEPLVTKKEICFFDLNINEYNGYHFLNFSDMFEKTELMIFTKEIPDYFFDDLSKLNSKVTLIIPGNFVNIIEKFKASGFSENITII